jgi:amino acid efflux transporter
VYWAFSVAVLSFGVYGDAHSDAASLPRLMQLLLGDQARWLVALVGYLACFASMNVYVQGFARLIWSLADEGKLPAPLAARNRHAVPGPALLLVVAICALCAGLAAVLQLSVDDLIRYANGNFILVYLLSMAAGVVLLRGIWRWVAAFSGLLCVLVLLALGLDALYALGLLAVIALLDRWRERQQAPQVSRS